MRPAPYARLDDPFPGEARPLAELYHQNTKLNAVNELAFGERIVDLSEDPEVLHAFSNSAKCYPGHLSFPLRSSFSERGGSLRRVLRRRRTRREFGAVPLRPETLAEILWFSAAETGSITSPAAAAFEHPLRAAPSAGALHSVEVYPLLFSANGVPPGAYHYNVPGHALELLLEGDLRERAAPHLMAPEMSPDAAGALVLAASLERVCAKYGERGYRFVHLDAGHLAQNVLLICEEIGVAAVPLGGFHDDALGELLGLDSREEIVIYVILLGGR